MDSVLGKRSRVSIEATDVVKLIEQFLQENKLYRTLDTLREESDNIALNSIPDEEKLKNEIKNGEWDKVLSQLSHLQLSSNVLIDIYEQIILELIEMKELEAARMLLRNTIVMSTLKQKDPQRFLRLEHYISQPIFDIRESYVSSSNGDLAAESAIMSSSSKAKLWKRKQLIEKLFEEINECEPSRLLYLLNQSLRWQKHVGLIESGKHFNIFEQNNNKKAKIEYDDQIPSQLKGTINFGVGNMPECAAFSSNGLYFITGSKEGFIEVWDLNTFRIRNDLEYQSKDELMMHESAIICLEFEDLESTIFAAGDKNGIVRLWDITNGQHILEINEAHSAGVSSLCFYRDATKLLTAGYDNLIHLYGLNSGGQRLRTFNQHTSYINSIRFNYNYKQVISTSSDGNIIIWDFKTTDVKYILHPHSGIFDSINQNKNPTQNQAQNIQSVVGSETLTELNIQKILPFSTRKNKYIIIPRANSGYIMNYELLKTYEKQLLNDKILNEEKNNININEEENKLNNEKEEVEEEKYIDFDFEIEKKKIGVEGMLSPGSIESGEFLDGTLSRQDNYVYLVSEKGMLCVFNTISLELERTLQISDLEVYGILHHPQENILVTWGGDGNLKVWS